MKKQEREIRTMCGGKYQPHVRETGEGENTTGRTIEGYAVVFGEESRMIVDWAGAYREIIEPGAVTDEELRSFDIKMTMFHNREKLLARSNQGAGTLKLSVDEIGVKYEFEAPNTATGDEALELVKRGDLAGSSFTYWSDETSDVTYTKREDETIERRVRHIGMIYEMTIASDPAYTQTSVTAREVEAHGVKLNAGPSVEEITKKREANAEAIAALRKRAKIYK